MLGRPQACAFIRLLHIVLMCGVLVLAHHLVEQNRYEVLGNQEGDAVVFDRLYGNLFIAPLPKPPTDAMIIQPRS